MGLRHMPAPAAPASQDHLQRTTAVSGCAACLSGQSRMLAPLAFPNALIEPPPQGLAALGGAALRAPPVQR